MKFYNTFEYLGEILTNYNWYTCRIRPLTAFISPLNGDMLFGRLCVMLAEMHGSQFVTDLLEQYLTGEPWAVVSDGFPSAYIPKPKIPVHLLQGTENNPENRKLEKKKIWLSLDDYTNNNSISELWVKAQALSDKKLDIEMHNIINRLTNTTDDEGFAPFDYETIWYSGQSVNINIHIILDEALCPKETLKEALVNIGKIGFGKEASTGKGKFELVNISANDLNRQKSIFQGMESYLTLAASAPQGLGFDLDHSFYNAVTRFPRHGAAQSSPYKTPLLLADTAAVFSKKVSSDSDEKTASPPLFIGQGIGNISLAHPKAVHQGYAPVLPIVLDCFDKSKECQS